MARLIKVKQINMEQILKYVVVKVSNERWLFIHENYFFLGSTVGGLFLGWRIRKFMDKSRAKTIDPTPTPIPISRKDKLINYLLLGLSFSIDFGISIPINRFRFPLFIKFILRVSYRTVLHSSFQLYFKNRMKNLQLKEFCKRFTIAQSKDKFLLPGNKFQLDVRGGELPPLIRCLLEEDPNAVHELMSPTAKLIIRNLLNNLVSECLILEPKALLLIQHQLKLPANKVKHLISPNSEFGRFSNLSNSIFYVKSVLLGITGVAVMLLNPPVIFTVSSFAAFAAIQGYQIYDPQSFKQLDCREAFQKQLQTNILDLNGDNYILNYASTREVGPANIYVLSTNYQQLFEKIDFDVVESWKCDGVRCLPEIAPQYLPSKAPFTLKMKDHIKQLPNYLPDPNEAINIALSREISTGQVTPLDNVFPDLPKETPFKLLEPGKCKRVTFDEMVKMANLDYSNLMEKFDTDFEPYVRFLQKEGIRVE